LKFLTIAGSRATTLSSDTARDPRLVEQALHELEITAGNSSSATSRPRRRRAIDSP